MIDERRVHFSGGVRTPTFEAGPGYAVCCSGDRARTIARAGRQTDDTEKVTCQKCTDTIDRAIGGPYVCDKPCSECSPHSAGFFGSHHFSDIVATKEDDENHPAVTVYGRDAWYRCKHCDAWALDETQEMA